jgi:hypothetical protein
VDRFAADDLIVAYGDHVPLGLTQSDSLADETERTVAVWTAGATPLSA